LEGVVEGLKKGVAVKLAELLLHVAIDAVIGIACGE
jgi:hypothetical protein